jgi:hypothetical protein
MDETKEIREALDLALREHNELMIGAGLPLGSKKIEKALSALAHLDAREAKKTVPIKMIEAMREERGYLHPTEMREIAARFGYEVTE